MKICILYDDYGSSSSVLKDVDPPGDPTAFLHQHEWQRVSIQKATAVRQIIELSRQGFDLFINLCDGAWDEDRAGIEVVQAMERLGLAYTGADSKFFEPSRELMKKVGHYWGVVSPASRSVRCERDIEDAARALRFPMIVKHPNSYSSIGMTRSSRVTNPEDLREQCHLVMRSFGAALVEEFIEGREFTVLVAENPDAPEQPIAYQPIEFLFPEGESFKHFDMKWRMYHEMKEVPVRDSVLVTRLQEMAQRLFVGLRGTGYGRCDIRMDAEGNLYMLEINPNCGIFYFEEDAGSADLCLLHDPRGHQHFVDTILRSALLRTRAQEPVWRLQLDANRGYGMVANRLILPGEMVEPFEETPHVLVSRSHALATWPAQKRRWFAQYAYPITDEIYVMWSDDPDEWKPLNHSCDPNCWLQGLDLVARRAIQPGEAITVDYATFCNESMEDFLCTCGAVDCRVLVRGSDYLQPFVARYGRYVSDYVRNKRRALGIDVPFLEPARSGSGLIVEHETWATQS